MEQVLHSIFLGLGLSADAFSMALVNGLRENRMNFSKMLKIAGVFAMFQTLMPLLGWYFVRGLLNCFAAVGRYIPLLSFLILFFIGGKMLIESLSGKSEAAAGTAAVFAQGFAGSVDALSAGLTFGGLPFLNALGSALIIGTVTFLLCISGIKIGKRAGKSLSQKAAQAGGIILILLGLKIILSP